MEGFPLGTPSSTLPVLPVSFGAEIGLQPARTNAPIPTRTNHAAQRTMITS
jgi:hypothetical protein